MARRRPAAPLASGEVLPLDLVPFSKAGLFEAFCVTRADGKFALDLEAHAWQEKAEAARQRGFDEWFAARGIKTRYADRDPRYLEILERSRAHWGLNHQGLPDRKRG